jgi:hypothetical protein
VTQKKSFDNIDGSTIVASSKTASIKDAEALVDATTQLYHETVMTCFGTMGK